MSIIAAEVKPEEVKKFNAEDFVASTKVEAKSTTVEKAEAIQPVETEIEEEEEEFEVVFSDDAKSTDTPIIVSKKDIYSSLREIDSDITDEDDAIARYKNTKDENTKLKIVSQGRTLIDTDSDILGWKQTLEMSQTEKAELAFYLKYKNDGHSEEKAIQKAKDKIASLEEVDVEAIEDESVKLTKWLNDSIKGKTKFIEEEILKNNVTLDVEDNVLSQIGTHILDTKEFLGMTLPKDDEKRNKILKDADTFAKTTEFKKILKDPKALAEIALFLKHKDQWTKNIKQRGTSKASIIDKMASAASVSPRSIERQKVEKQVGFNPTGFK